MHTLSQELLVSVPESHTVTQEIPVEVLQTIEQFDFSQISDSESERVEAQLTFLLWSKTLLEIKEIILSHLKNVTDTEKQAFSVAFTKALCEYIKHPDHGMTHSYFVYKGMLYLHKLETHTDPSNEVDIEMQLLAVLHDAFQTLPYEVAGENCGIVSKVQKNDHARIVAVILKRCAHLFNIPQQKAKELAFALEMHDSSYDRILYPEQMCFTGQLLHDSDKLFGTATTVDPQLLARGLFRRNAIANSSSSGAYLMRAELKPDYRQKITYGDRCYSDGFSLALAEVSFPMYTNSAQAISKERKKHAEKELLKVYSDIFDNLNQVLQTIIIPNLSQKDMQVFAVSLGNTPKRLTHITNATDLANTINEMYTTVLTLPKAYHRNSYVTPNDSRGWKLEVLYNQNEFIIDPSIARFCFMKNGKQEFLRIVSEAFTAVVPIEDKKAVENQ